MPVIKTIHRIRKEEDDDKFTKEMAEKIIGKIIEEDDEDDELPCATSVVTTIILVTRKGLRNRFFKYYFRLESGGDIKKIMKEVYDFIDNMKDVKWQNVLTAIYNGEFDIERNDARVRNKKEVLEETLREFSKLRTRYYLKMMI